MNTPSPGSFLVFRRPCRCASSAMFQGQVRPRINAIGSIVFTITMTLVILAQAILLLRRPARAPDQVKT